jgi:putative ABC transport system substrate-binding protein
MPIGRIKRRVLIRALGGILASPLVARAQDRIRRIGVLMNFTPGDAVAEARLSTFLRALESLGWTQGRSIQIETRWAEGSTERIQKNAAELVALSPDPIFVTTTPAVMVLKRVTKSGPTAWMAVLSQSIAHSCGQPVLSLGPHELRGVTGMREM